MEPLPETAQAIDELARTDADPGPEPDPGLLADLQKRCERVRRLVPRCVGLSLASRAHGVTFTLVASDREIAALDAVQYLAGGPCVDAVRAEQVTTFGHSAAQTDERGWQLFAQATAAHHVASTLTLPVLSNGEVVGSINLYAATDDAFDGHHVEIASIFDAWAPGAVTNADLAFATRDRAREAPRLLRREKRVQLAVGIIATVDQIAADDAFAKLCDAAHRAGLDLAQFAEVVISLRGSWEDH